MTREEAINEIRSWDFLNEKESEAVRTLIPELRESEDERIRKGLQNFLWRIANGEMNDRGTMPSAKMCQEWIVWIEKQKEPEVLPGFDEMTPEEKMNSPLYLEGFDVGRKVGRIEAEQKPAEWSEEDEKMLTDTIFKLAGFMGNEKNIDWLKSRCLSWKPSEQKEQKQNKWSKKDKKILQSLHHVMNCADAQNVVKRDGLRVEDVCTFLFSIEPNWKPSKEQIECLRKVVHEAELKHNVSVGGYADYQFLRSLLQELIKQL